MESPDLPTVVSINGKIMFKEEAKISVFDRGFLYGDSVYEVIRTYEGIPFLLQEHLNRLWHSASKLEMGFPFDQNNIVKEVNTCLGELGKENAYIRIIITRGQGPLQLDPVSAGSNNIVVITREFKENPKEWYKNGVNIIISNVERTSIRAIDPNIKSGNYLNNIMAFIHAKKQHAFDAVMLNSQGYITEGTTHNIWVVKKGKAYTPPLHAGILEGITRKTVLVLAKKNGIEVEQKNMTAEDLINADECFMTSTTKEVIPVTQVNNAPIGTGEPGPITAKLHKLYQDFIQQQIALS
ncbi:MAG: branched-chain-amino-acid transaminase [Epsilonproteobacteria bacterium]|nr:MAG: branched-chain-amino-acid transaminase [Campylobacterota bacterium]